ncbi:MAG TPA: hypothetical protein VF708_16980 [Pyrinomonadaceae bacterium]|jgi:ribosome-associated translation inhibitor RaiA
MNSAPKYQFEHPAGQTLSPQIKESLLRFFQETELQKLERAGGSITIRISLAKRRKSREKNDDLTVSFDETFIQELEKASNSEEQINRILDRLTVKQLRKLGEILKLHFRSKSSAKEMKQEIVGLFNHAAMWRSISNS